MLRRCLPLVVLMLVGAAVAAEVPGPRVRLVSAKTEGVYRGLVPESVDGVLGRLRGVAVFYDEEVLPGVHQDWHGALRGIRWNFQNVSANRVEPFGSANQEFPWVRPMGLRPGDNARSFRFFVFPGSERVVVWRRFLEGDKAGGTWLWSFPVGTTFGEVLTVHSAELGRDFTFEVRVRNKLREGGLEAWAVNVYRPFGSPGELVAAAEGVAGTEQLVAGLAAPVLRLKSFRDRHDFSTSQGAVRGLPRLGQVFDRSGLEEDLAPVPAAAVVKLLERPFVSVLGRPWREAGGKVGHAPSTSAAFHVVPKDYLAYMVEVSKASCVGCHESALKRADEFDPLRDWYGRVKGNVDGIFSWHPVSISDASGADGQTVFNPKLVPLLEFRK